MLRRDRLVDLRELALGALDGHTRRESRDHPQMTTRPAGVWIRDRIAEDAPDLRAGSRDVIEPLRHHADDGHERAADRDRLANDGRISAEPTLPECVADDDHALSTGNVLVGAEV